MANVYPVAASTGHRLTGIMTFMRDVHTGGGVLDAWRIRVSTDTPQTVIVYDTLLRDQLDDHIQGQDWWDIPVELLNVTSGGLFYWGHMDRDTVDGEGAWSTPTAFTMGTAPVLGSNWRERL